VDNASSDDTPGYLQVLAKAGEIDLLILSDENLYPGQACNLGWEEGLKEFREAELLHRSDNDIFYRIRWDTYAEKAFDAFPKMGQLGLLDLYDLWFPGLAPQHRIIDKYSGMEVFSHPFDIGGAYVIRREIWDGGIRHIEDSWEDEPMEDRKISEDIREAGWETYHSPHTIAVHLGALRYGYRIDDEEYYTKSFNDRRDEKGPLIPADRSQVRGIA